MYGVDFFSFSSSPPPSHHRSRHRSSSPTPPATDPTHTSQFNNTYGSSSRLWQYKAHLRTRRLGNPAVVITTTTELPRSVGGVLRSFSAVGSLRVPPPHRSRMQPERELRRRTVSERNECVLYVMSQVCNAVYRAIIILTPLSHYIISKSIYVFQNCSQYLNTLQITTHS